LNLNNLKSPRDKASPVYWQWEEGVKQDDQVRDRDECELPEKVVAVEITWEGGGGSPARQKESPFPKALLEFTEIAQLLHIQIFKLEESSD
jgi:hypothetical protein